MPDEEQGHVSSGNALSGVYRSVVPWDRGHQLSGRAHDVHSAEQELDDEVHELDAAVAQARARVAKSAQKSVAAQEERPNMSADLTV